MRLCLLAGPLAMSAALSYCAALRAVPLPDVPLGDSVLNVEDDEFLGSGEVTTYLVVDFRGAGGGSFAFGYEHAGMETGEDMLATFDTAGVLDVFLEEFSFGPALRGVAYPREAQEDVFPAAFGGERGWVLWEGAFDNGQVVWETAEVGLNGVEFGNSEPTVFLPENGFYGLSTAPEFPGPPPLLPLPGDFNSDGRVDASDLLDALVGFGTDSGPTLARGDADRDGDVDRADLLLWKEHLGATVPVVSETPAASVPEPATLGMLLLCCTAIHVGRRKRRKGRFTPRS